MKLLQTFLTGTALALASGVAAQTAPQDMAPGDAAETTTEAPADGTTPIDQMADAPMTEDPAAETPATEAPAPDAPAADATTSTTAFSDTQIKGFVTAAMKIEEIKNDPATNNEKIVEVVSQSGIDVETFNAISAAMDSDPKVAERVQIAAREMQKTAG